MTTILVFHGLILLIMRMMDILPYSRIVKYIQEGIVPISLLSYYTHYLSLNYFMNMRQRQMPNMNHKTLGLL